MNQLELIGLVFVIVFFGLMLTLAILSRTRPVRQFREIQAFTRLRHAVGLAVEAGNRLHLSIGRGNLTGPQSAVAFVGLTVLDRIARSTMVSDRPPVVTSGEGAISVLSQDSLRGASRAIGAEFDPLRGRLTGLTPFSYVAGTLPVIYDEDVGANLFIGSFGSELALMNEAGERAGSLTLAGTDNLSGQAVLYATAEEPLIGEETYASGAYLGAGAMHIASLRAQDISRWVIISLILLGALLKLIGVL